MRTRMTDLMVSPKKMRNGITIVKRKPAWVTIALFKISLTGNESKKTKLRSTGNLSLLGLNKTCPQFQRNQ